MCVWSVGFEVLFTATSGSPGPTSAPVLQFLGDSLDVVPIPLPPGANASTTTAACLELMKMGTLPSGDLYPLLRSRPAVARAIETQDVNVVAVLAATLRPHPTLLRSCVVANCTATSATEGACAVTSYLQLCEWDPASSGYVNTTATAAQTAAATSSCAPLVGEVAALSATLALAIVLLYFVLCCWPLHESEAFLLHAKVPCAVLCRSPVRCLCCWAALTWPSIAPAAPHPSICACFAYMQITAEQLGQALPVSSPSTVTTEQDEASTVDISMQPFLNDLDVVKSLPYFDRQRTACRWRSSRLRTVTKMETGTHTYTHMWTTPSLNKIPLVALRLVYFAVCEPSPVLVLVEF